MSRDVEDIIDSIKMAVNNIQEYKDEIVRSLHDLNHQIINFPELITELENKLNEVADDAE